MRNIFLIILSLVALPCFSWDGFDYRNANFIEIVSGDIEEGENVEIFDYSTASYKYVKVVEIYGNEIKVYDYETKKLRIFDMD